MITIPWGEEHVVGEEIFGLACKGAGTDRTTLLVPPTSVVMTTVLDADDTAWVAVLETLAFVAVWDVSATVVETEALLTEVFGATWQ